MKRIVVMTTLTVFALIISGLSQSSSQTSPRGRGFQRIQVNARTITALPRAQEYVVDLTRLGVKYEFDPKDGQIDFNRVVVRTARSEVALNSFLEKTFPKDKLAELKLSSQRFFLATEPKGSAPTSPVTATRSSRPHTCRGGFCECYGTLDCFGMIYQDCQGRILCMTRPDGSIIRCICVDKTATPV